MSYRGQAPPPPPPPRIPESWLSASEQRFYVAAIAGGLQVYKLSDALFHFYRTTLSTSVVPTTSTFLSPIAIINRFLPFNLANWLPFLSLDASAASTYLTKWVFWDWAVIALVMWLRVPGLRYGRVKGGVYAVLFALFDALVFGTLGVWAGAANLLLFIGKVITNTRGQVTTLGNKAAKPWKVIDQEQHLLGHRSIRVLPHGTALFNPLSSTYCLEPGTGQEVLIPLITNNSEPYHVYYTVQSLTDPDAKPERKRIHASQLIRGDRRLLHRKSGENEEDVDDYYLDGRSTSPPPSSRQPHHAGPATHDAHVRRSIRAHDKVSPLPRSIEPSQTIYYLQISQPGEVQLERVQDADESDFRITKTSRQALVIECPSGGKILGVEGEKDEAGEKRRKLALMPLVKKEDKVDTPRHRCVGQDDVVQMEARGVGDLKIGYLLKEGKGKDQRVIEEGVLSGIQSETLATRQPLMLKDKSDDPSDTDRQVAVRSGEMAVTRYAGSALPDVAETRLVRLPIAHRQVGTHAVQFLNVTDSFGNFYRSESDAKALEFVVHALPVVSFSNHCAQPRTLKLLQGGSVSLPIIMPGLRQPEGITRVWVAHKPVGSDTYDEGREYEMDGKSKAVEVREPGTYTIVDTNSTFCSGLVHEPATCVVEAVPVPKAEVKMTSLSNECAGDTGVEGIIEFIGTPPFKATYKVESGNRVTTKHVNSQNVIAEFKETPPSPGQYTYTVVSIGDKHYSDVPIEQKPFKQTVHPLPRLTVPSRARRTIWSCATNQTSVDLNLSGMGPFTVDYTVGWSTDSVAKQATFARPGSHQIHLDVPPAVAATGGSFSMTFSNLKDVNGCTAKMTDQSVSYDVQTTRPTAKFGDTSVAHTKQVVEGASARAVIRLTGEGPWTVGYVHSDNPKKVITQNFKVANAPLEINRKGTYRLVQVADAHCPGNIVEDSDSYELTYYSRPTVQLPAETVRHKKGQHYERPAICAGVEDHMTVALQGTSPFHVRYRHDHTLPDKTKYSEEKDIDSAQEIGLLPMASQPGQHKYTILAVKDANYDFDQKLLQSSTGLFSIEQEVFGKPNAGFRTSSRFSYCVGEAFKASRDNSATIEFIGQGPFEVDLEVGPPGGGRPLYKTTINNIKSNSWKVQLPDHKFSHVGPQLLQITSVRDASGCPAEILNDDSLYLGIDVLETATITPVSEREDYCVGDMLEFVLGGTAPWHVSYKFGKKTHQVIANKPQFFRLAERAGDLEIKSVSNKNNKCSASVQDIRRKIHPLPKAKIEEGKPWLQEGSETEITFSFVGTPPFTFTYTRSESDGRKGARVVDTQTISDIPDNTYTFSTAMEGEYDVTYIKDAFCSYPPEPRSAESKQKLLQW